MLALVALVAPPSASALVLNEIMYHSEEVDDRPFEWLELYNENLDPIDLSGYLICNGVRYEVPAGTWLEGFEYIVIASDPAQFQSKYDAPGARVIGGWSGALDNGGERIEICNASGVTLVDVDYNDRGKWPGAADGAGHTLSLVDPYTENGDADSWTHSLAPGGTPGAWNGHAARETSSGGPQEGMDGSGFLTDWLLLGAYTGASCGIGNTALRADWLRGTTAPLETDLVWRDLQPVPTNYSAASATGILGGGTPRVRLHRNGSDTVDLNAIYSGDPDQVMAYAFVYVDNVTGANLGVTFGVASDDSIDVLLNGVHVHTNDVCRGVGGSGEVQDRFNATLRPGKNLVAVKVFENGGGWSFRLRVEERSSQQPITSPATIQVMTDVDLGLDFDGDGTPLIDPGDVGGGPDPDDVAGARPVVINEGSFTSAGDRWVELHNRSSSSVDLSGWFLTDDSNELAKAALPAGTVLPAGGFLTYTDAALGLDFVVSDARPRVWVGLIEDDGVTVHDAYNFEPGLVGYSEARIPDGDRELDDGADPTRGASNEISAPSEVVSNEIMYHPIDDDPLKEYVELYNRGDVAVDLSGWELQGAGFDFPDGVTIPARGYLVVSPDPDRLRAVHGLGPNEVVGPIEPSGFGTLRNRGERLTLKDALGRTADTVRYVDGGEWPRWADGHGASLELADAWQDNRFGQAWDASDDSDEAPIERFQYTSRHVGGESELHVLLLSRGIAVVDDLTVHSGAIARNDDPLIERGDTWRYLKGLAPPPADWNQPGFDDSSWSSGPTGIGFGDDDDATILDDMQGNYLTIFCRHEFDVPDPGALDDIILEMRFDDGFVAFLNGQEVGSFNVREREYDSPATGSTGDYRDIDIDLTPLASLLVPGTNVLAVQVHNRTIDNSDLSFAPRLVSRTLAPGPGATQHVVNGTFDSSASGWLIEGNHVRSGRTTDDPIRGNGSLKLVATGRGDNKVNRLETSNAGMSPSLPTGSELLIGFSARWVIGSQSILTHGYQHGMARSHRLGVPETLGTPGRINSATQRLEARASGNAGPVMSDIRQDPAVPEADEPVTIRMRVVDSDGVQAVRLRHAANSPSGSVATIAMTPIGDDWYECEVPGRGARQRTLFYIEAEDSLGAEGRYPVDVSLTTHPLVLRPESPPSTDERWLIYRHDDPDPSTPYHSYRFWMSSAHESLVAARKLQSNDLVPGSFIFGSRRIYHESKARFAGSPWARQGWGGSWRTTLPRGDELHGVRRKFNLENHGSDARERISHYLLRQANLDGVRVPYSDEQVMVRWQVNDRTTATREHVHAPDTEYLDQWWPDDEDGDLFEVDDRFLFNDGGSRQSSEDGRLRYPPPSPANDSDGMNPENYRWFFGLRVKNGADDYSRLIDFARVMDPTATPTATFDDVAFDVMNVESMLRVWAVRMNTDDWDTWGTDRGKNCYLYHAPIEDRWYLLPWDMELTYDQTGRYLIPSSPTSAFNPGGGKFAEVNRMMNRPAIKRRYYAIMAEMVNGAGAWFDSDFLDAYMSRLAAIGMGNTGVGRAGGYVDQRANLIRPRIASVTYPTLRMRITTNGGSDFSVDETTVDIAGAAPVEVDAFVVVRDGVEAPYEEVRHASVTGFDIRGIELEPGENRLTILGFSARGELVDDVAIDVTSTAIVTPAPTLADVSPSTALPGETVTITGTGLLDGAVAYFGDVAATTLALVGSTGIEVSVPEAFGAVEITVRNPGSEASNALPFEYPPSFVRGDTNRDGGVDLSDSIRLLLHLFGGLPMSCEEAGDADDDGVIGINDAVLLLDHLFRDGASPAAPYPGAGYDTDGDAITCAG